jgi:hypothetical protein
MPAHYYRLLAVSAASLSLLLGGCSLMPGADTAAPPPQQASINQEDDPDADSTLWTVLGIADKPLKNPGPVTGRDVSPVIWQAALDTFSFASIDSADPMAGLLVTNWYTPKGRATERMRFTAFIKARVLRSDAISVTVQRQVRGPDGQWRDSTIAGDVAQSLETSILQRAREIHIAHLNEKR